MKAFLSVIILYSLFWGLSTAKAQESEPTSAWKVTLESAGVCGSYYSPSLGFWNNVSEIRNWDQKFQAFPMYGANLEIGLRNNLRVRAEGGFASGKARQSVIPSDLGGGSQSKTINLVPLSAILLYQFSDEFILIPYLGAGAGTMFITSTYDRNTETTPAASNKASATDYMLYGVGGIKYPAASNLSIGPEVRGAFGNYKELVMNTHNVYNMQHISLDGVQVLLSLNYTFGKK
jgi:hypothetical protein